MELGKETIKYIQGIKGFLVILDLDKKIIVEVNVTLCYRRSIINEV